MKKTRAGLSTIIFFTLVLLSSSFFESYPKTLNSSHLTQEETVHSSTQRVVDWTVSASDPYNQKVNDVATLSNGDTIIVGYFIGTLTIGSFNLTNQGPMSRDPFVIRLDQHGFPVWAISATGSGQGFAYSVSIASDDSILIGGSFTETFDFGGHVCISEGDEDGYVSKITSGGHWEWTRCAGGTWTDKVNSVSWLSNGDMIASGDFGGGLSGSGDRQATFGTDLLMSNGDFDFFIWRIDGNGTHAWANGFGEANADHSNGLAIDSHDNIWVTGAFMNNLQLGGTQLTSNGYTDLYIAKSDEHGTWEWAKSAGHWFQDRGLAVVVDGSGVGYLTGMYRQTAIMGSTTLSSINNTEDGFVAAINSQGVWQWANSFGSEDMSDFGAGLAVGNQLHLIGVLYERGIFGNLSTNHTELSDIFLATLSLNGSWTNVAELTGIGFDEIGGVALDSNEQPVIGGAFTDSITIDGKLYSGDNDYDFFAVKYITDSDGDGIDDSTDLCPNTPLGESVNSQGCAPSQLDSDSDGVNDALDTCPDTEIGDEVDEFGCSAKQRDSDSDGVMDAYDMCENTTFGEVVDADGCAPYQRDSDNDGVTDDIDLCPETGFGVEVDEQGCSAAQNDADSDGVTNSLDLCPNTPSSESVDVNGCSLTQLDGDLDMVNDADDWCPQTPTNERGEVDNHGCAPSERDEDADGTNDRDDLCPNTPNSKMVDSDGCSASQRDGDLDGITDDLDSCPNTQTGLEVNQVGCAENQLDADGDGVSDHDDVCPDTAVGRNVDSSGCSPWQNDEDSDGVFDAYDDCSMTPLETEVDNRGCPLTFDEDRDGVTDDVDECPNTLHNESVGTDGCPLVEEERVADAFTPIIGDKKVVAGLVGGGLTLATLLSFLFSRSEVLKLGFFSKTAWFWTPILGSLNNNDDKEIRHHIIEFLSLYPGAHKKMIKEELGLTAHSICINLKLLEKEKLIWSVKEGTSLRFYQTNGFPKGTPVSQLPKPTKFPKLGSHQFQIMHLVAKYLNLGTWPGQKVIAEQVNGGISQQLCSHHLRVLVKKGLLRKKRIGMKNEFELTQTGWDFVNRNGLDLE